MKKHRKTEPHIVHQLRGQAAELMLMAVKLRDEVFDEFPEKRAEAERVTAEAIRKAKGE